MVLAGTEFNLTLFPQEQAWGDQANLGPGVLSLWTGTSCVGTVPGRLFGLPVSQCSRVQFQEEVLAQIYACQSLDQMIREANAGRGLQDFTLLHFEIWHEWKFTRDGLVPVQPKWVNTSGNQKHLPEQKLSITNLFLAGAHTRTQADVWSIEAAVESGRRAARAWDPRVPLKLQYKPRWLKVLSQLDDFCYQAGAPHILDLTLAAGLAGVAWIALKRIRSSLR